MIKFSLPTYIFRFRPLVDNGQTDRLDRRTIIYGYTPSAAPTQKPVLFISNIPNVCKVHHNVERGHEPHSS